MDLLADFLHFGASDFPSKILLKSASKSSFFLLWRRDPVVELKSNGCRGLECEARSVKCEVWSVKEAVGSEKCEV